MKIKEQLEHAKEYGYPVRVTWRRGNGEGIEDGIVSCTMLNGFNFHNDDRKHDYAYIESVEPSEPEVNHYYPHCDETECSEREGSGLYCKREECDTRNIFVDYAHSFREDPKPGEAGPADDIAKQRWVYTPRFECVNPVATKEESLPAALFGLGYGTHEQMFVAAAAPEMLDALKMVVNKSVFSRVESRTRYYDVIKVRFNPDQWRIITDAVDKVG